MSYFDFFSSLFSQFEALSSNEDNLFECGWTSLRTKFDLSSNLKLKRHRTIGTGDFSYICKVARVE